MLKFKQKPKTIYSKSYYILSNGRNNPIQHKVGQILAVRHGICGPALQDKQD